MPFVSTTLTRTVLIAPLRGVPSKYWAKRYVACTTSFISSVARFAPSNTSMKQMTATEKINNHRISKMKKLVSEHFNLDIWINQ